MSIDTYFDDSDDFENFNDQISKQLKNKLGLKMKMA